VAGRRALDGRRRRLYGQPDQQPQVRGDLHDGLRPHQSVKAVGKYEVDYTLTSVFAPFFGDVGVGTSCPSISWAASRPKIKNNKAYNQKPLASGPFKITEYAGGDHVTETANKTTSAGRRTWTRSSSASCPTTTAINQIQTGEISLLGRPHRSRRQFNLLKRFPTVKTYNTPGNNWAHLDLIQAGFFKDRTVRQALAYATPKQQIIDQVALGYGTIDDADQAPTNPTTIPPSRTRTPTTRQGQRACCSPTASVGRAHFAEGRQAVTIILAGDTKRATPS
jgi:ABC-type transport system substrate-binding protein